MLIVSRRLAVVVSLTAILVSAEAVLAQSDAPWVAKLDTEARLLALADTPDARSDRARFVSATHDVFVQADGAVGVGILVLLDDPMSAPLLRSTGFRLQTLAGHVAVGTIDGSRLGEVARLRAVRSVEVSRYVEVLNDLGNAAINSLGVHLGTGLPAPYRGEGVVVGVLDTGIDFSHPDFSDAHGTRIEYLLEYLPDDDNNPPVAQAEWTAQQIDETPEVVTQRDIHGHGTHVAGTAGGGGVASASLHGSAPASRMIVVKGSRTGTDPDRPHVFSERDMINGAAYVFERAAELEMPAVVNFSIGSPGPPLDGSVNVNVAMSALTGPGRIIVFAAGNDGAFRLHWGADLAPGARAAMVPRYATFTASCCGQAMVIETWYEPEALGSVTVTARDATTMEALGSLLVPVGHSTSGFRFMSGHTAEPLGWVDVDASLTAHPANGDGFVRVVIANMGSPVNLNDHVWSISLEAAAGGRADAWLLTRAMGQFDTAATGIPAFVSGDNLMTLNRLAAGHEIVVAGSFTTRNEWIQASGEPIVFEFGGEPIPIGARTYFSSLGPTRDGRVRPDVMAPGAMILSTRSSDASFGWSYLGEPQYALLGGTSMAAPFTTGVIALMLQVDPELAPEEVRQLLRSTAVADEFTGGVPNPEYGYGKLDALAAVQATLAGVSSEEGPAARAGLRLEAPFPNPSRAQVTLLLNLPRPDDLSIGVYDLVGRRVRLLNVGYAEAGPHRVQLERDGLAAGVYLVVLQAAGERRTQRVVFVD